MQATARDHIESLHPKCTSSSSMKGCSIAQDDVLLAACLPLQPNTALWPRWCSSPDDAAGQGLSTQVAATAAHCWGMIAWIWQHSHLLVLKAAGRGPLAKGRLLSLLLSHLISFQQVGLDLGNLLGQSHLVLCAQQGGLLALRAGQKDGSTIVAACRCTLVVLFLAFGRRPACSAGRAHGAQCLLTAGCSWPWPLSCSAVILQAAEGSTLPSAERAGANRFAWVTCLRFACSCWLHCLSSRPVTGLPGT